MTGDVSVWLPLSLLGALVWGVWLIRQVLGAGYRPAQNDHWESTSVIVPIYREDWQVLERCLESWEANNPSEILLVVDHTEKALIPMVEARTRDEPRIRVIVVTPPGKRHALATGIRAAKSDILVLTDSDTMWAQGFLAKILMAFADSAVGGVGCRQNVFQPGTSIWRRLADWMLDVRFLHQLPPMARKKAIPCISGRTASYRRQAVLPVVDELEYETFWGKPCVSGDDGRLTWLILRDGWKTAYQINARAWTVFPNSFRGFLQQRVRWSRNSYRCYFRAMWKGWMWRQPLITPMSVIQNLTGPFTLLIPVGLLIWAIIDHSWFLAAVVGAWLLLGRAIKGVGHLLHRPEALLYLPLITVVFIIVMIPVKVYSLLTLNKQGWITRTSDKTVAEGQGSETLSPELQQGLISPAQN